MSAGCYVNKTIRHLFFLNLSTNRAPSNCLAKLAPNCTPSRIDGEQNKRFYSAKIPGIDVNRHVQWVVKKKNKLFERLTGRRPAERRAVSL